MLPARPNAVQLNNRIPILIAAELRIKSFLSIDAFSRRKTSSIYSSSADFITVPDFICFIIIVVERSCIEIALRISGNPEEIRRHGKVVWCKIVKPGEYHSGIHLEDKYLNSIDLVLRTIKAQRNY